MDFWSMYIFNQRTKIVRDFIFLNVISAGIVGDFVIYNLALSIYSILLLIQHFIVMSDYRKMINRSRCNILLLRTSSILKGIMQKN